MQMEVGAQATTQFHSRESRDIPKALKCMALLFLARPLTIHFFQEFFADTNGFWRDFN